MNREGSGVKQKDEKYICGTYKRQDVLFERGEGSVLIDEEGKRYIDFGGGIAVNTLGYADDEWIKAVTDQLMRISHTSNLFYTRPQVELAERLIRRTGMEKVFFSNSGAEANEAAVKCARKYSFDKYGEGRYEIITLENSFHGRTMATITATGQKVFHNYFMPFLDGFKYVKAGDSKALREAVGPKTAAIMAELIQGEGGVEVLDREFVAEIAEICAEKDVLLIVDEVQTGNGRTGSLYCYEQFGLHPDIVTTAKGLAGGLPLGVTMFGKKTAEVLSQGTHGSTFGGNPVCCAAAINVLDRINDKLLNSVKEKFVLLKQELADCPSVRSISGMGLMIGIECDDAAGKVELLRKNGLIVLTAKNKLRLLPPLNISDDTFARGLKILKEVL